MSVDIDLVRCLEAVRELYRQPRGFERFQGYLDLVRTQTGTMALPLSMLNPMAKPHALERIEQLIAVRAEDLVLEAAREISTRLEGVDDALHAIVVLVDDALGGWTNRAFAEFAYRYERKHEIEHGWATVIVWTSEEPTPELIAMRTREAIYRTLDERKRGPARTLREILEREGRTMRFAGYARRYDDATISGIHAKAEPHMNSAKAPALFALLYGDAVATSLGYPTLGIPERGGYDLALAMAEKAHGNRAERDPHFVAHGCEPHHD